MATTKVFDLSNKALKLDTADDIKSHIEPLTASADYTSILFNGNTIGVEAARHFATVLRRQKSLREVQFSDIFTGRLLSEIPDALSALLEALLELPELHKVDLSDNAFGLNLVAPLVSFLKAHVPLQHLVLNNNGMGPIAGAQIADALTELAARKKEAKAKAEVPELESIVCGRNRLESGSMEAWARAYSALGTVRSVRMTQNGIRPEGIVQLLSGGLAACPTLEVVDLQDNTFTAAGAGALAGVLPRWEGLVELSVNDCLVTGRGFAKVAKVLAAGSNRKLRTLRMTYNEVGGAGLAAILAAADKGGLPELRRAELNGNKFPEDDPAVEQLRDLLDERRKEAGADEDDEAWGIDELDDMEDESDEEEDEEDEEDEETEAKAEKDVADAKKAEDEPVPQEKDADVDALADALGKKLEV